MPHLETTENKPSKEALALAVEWDKRFQSMVVEEQDELWPLYRASLQVQLDALRNGVER